MNPDGGMHSDRWQAFVAFWFLGGVTLLAVGILMFVAVRHGHRVGAVIALVGIPCFAIGVLVRRAGRNQETLDR